MKNDLLNAVFSFSIVVLSGLIGSATYSANNTDALTSKQPETLEEIRNTLEEQLGVVSPVTTEESQPIPVEIITEAELRAEQEAKIAESEKIMAAKLAAEQASTQAVSLAEKAAAAKQAEEAALAAEKLRQEQAKLEANRLAAEQAAALAAQQKAIAQAEAKAKADALAAQVAAQKASRKSRAS